MSQHKMATSHTYGVEFVQVGFLHDNGFFHPSTRPEAAPCIAAVCERVFKRRVACGSSTQDGAA